MTNTGISVATGEVIGVYKVTINKYKKYAQGLFKLRKRRGLRIIDSEKNKAKCQTVHLSWVANMWNSVP